MEVQPGAGPFFPANFPNPSMRGPVDSSPQLRRCYRIVSPRPTYLYSPVSPQYIQLNKEPTRCPQGSNRPRPFIQGRRHSASPPLGTRPKRTAQQSKHRNAGHDPSVQEGTWHKPRQVLGTRQPTVLTKSLVVGGAHRTLRFKRYRWFQVGVHVTNSVPPGRWNRNLLKIFPTSLPFLRSI